MYPLLSVLSAAAYVVITSGYNNIWCIMSTQLSTAISPEDPYTVAVRHCWPCPSCVFMHLHNIIKA